MTVFSLCRRASIAGLLTSSALLFALPASAAGSITITQKSPIGVFGNWTLTQPSSGQVTVQGGETRSFPIAEVGTYSILVTPPTDAKYAATVITDGTQSLATTLKNFTFDVAEGQSVDITLSYRYDGTIVVDSEPQGASFELLGNSSLRLTGVTPATFTGLAPLTYRVTFQRLPNCFILPMQQRSLQPNQTLSFFGSFTCGSIASSSSSSTSSETTTPSPEVPNERTVQIWVAAHQSEVLPGNPARFTITVKNTGDRTVHDVSVSAQFDPARLSAISPLPRFGRVDGNVVAWDVPELLTGKFWSVTLPLTVSDSLKQGDKVSVTARVSGSDITGGDDAQHVATMEIGVMTALPQTGVRFDVLFLLMAMLCTSCLALVQQRRAVTVRA